MIKYKVGDTVLFKWPGLFSYSFVIGVHNYIHFHENKATHAGIISRIDGDDVYIHEAIAKWDAKDYQEHKYSKFDLDSYIINNEVIIRRPYLNLKGYEKACKGYEDNYYDWLSILLMPFKISFNTPNLIFCSEVNGRIYYDLSNHKINIAEEFGISYEKLTPMHLYLTKQLYTVS